MRIAYHLCIRARRLGYDIEPAEVYSPERFGMSPAMKYAVALQAEAKALVAATFRPICSQPISPGFTAIYQRDQRRWLNAHPERQRNQDEFDIAT
ncbi:MAG TPA: hypothetical protein DCY79_06710 [Planctomycetaceae bacterium]|nr:hypothetical protein [Planctomycetaceae bacterium]|tara:strand:+ start:907 stop:1191 length:285 start_codon:yes stop_codon:yes gene_type:complete